MANNEFTIPIPARLKNVAKGGHVAGADQIIDDALGKEQSVINKEVSEAIEGNTQAVAAERQRAEAAEGVLDNRLSDVEELAEISIDGGEAKIATGEDFHNPTAEQRAKVTTVGAILDGADNEPTAGSDNLVKSGGVNKELFNYKSNTALNNSGVEIADSSYCVSDYIEVENGDVVVFNNVSGGNAALYNSNKEFLQRWMLFNQRQETINNENAAYIRYAFPKANIKTTNLTKNSVIAWEAVSIRSNKYHIDKLKEEVDSDYEQLTDSVNESINYLIDSTINSSGQTTAREGYICTKDYIDISGRDRDAKMIAWYNGAVTNKAYIAFYDSSKAFISSVSGTEYNMRTMIEIPSTAHYIKAGFSKNYTDNKIVVGSTIVYKPEHVSNVCKSFYDFAADKDHILIARNCIVDAKITPSGILSSEDTVATDFIDVHTRKDNVIDWIYGTTADTIYITEYAQNYTVIRSTQNYVGSNHRSITLDDNTYYIRATLNRSIDSGIVVDGKLAYVPIYGNQDYVNHLNEKVDANNSVANCTFGYKLNGVGALIEDKTSVVSDLIDVHDVGDSTLLWWHGYTEEGNNRYIVAFDSSLNILSYALQFGSYYRDFNLPNGTYYVRASFAANQTFPHIITKRIDNEVVYTCINKATNKAVLDMESKRDNDYFSYVVPEYYKSHLASKINAINLRDASCGSNSDSFVFITDCHMEFNYNHSPQLVKEIFDKTSVKKVINGGDIIHVQGTKNDATFALKKWMSRFSFCDSYLTIGNHDTNGVIESQAEMLSNGELYGTLIKPFENKVVSNKQNYYYFDNENQKIRYFVLDIHWPTSPDNRGVSLEFPTQLSWLETKSQEIGATWNIAVFAHIVFIGPPSAPRLCSLGEDLVSKLDEMADNPNMPSIIGVFCGHTHYDHNIYSSKGYPIIATWNDSSFEKDDNGRDVGFYCHERVPLTITEQSFDVVHIDITARKIYMERVGYGSNREFTF